MANDECYDTLQHPLILEPKVFQQALELKNDISDHVIPLLEYIVGMKIILYSAFN